MAPTFVKTALSGLILLSTFTFSDAARVHVSSRENHQRLHRRALTPPATLPNGWTSKGCYFDGVNGRTLTGQTYASGTLMTDESCVAFCTQNNYIYAGTEYSSECYCGNTIAGGAGPAPAADCSMACSGNANEPCGGPNRLNIFTSGATPQPGPVTNPGVGGYASIGCYAEGTNGRALTSGQNTAGGSGKMTIALCVSACQAAGFSIAGAEYSGECYCGNAFSNGALPATSGCEMTCNGNSSEFCGGGSRLNAYKLGAVTPSSTAGSSSAPVSSTVPSSTAPSSTAPTTTPTATGPATVPAIGAYKFLGCYTEATGVRALSGKAVNQPTMSLELCASSCTGYTYWGVEYGTECYCGNTLGAGSVLAPNQGDCSFLCPGNQNEYCGAGNRLEMYQLNGTAQTSSSTTPTPTSSTPTSSGTGSATGLPAGWTYAGCYTEGDGGRALTGTQQPDSQTLTIESCVAACKTAGYSAAGMEFAAQCFCGNAINNGGALVADTDCNQACSGNANEKCGGPSRLSVYSNGPILVNGKPAPQTGGLPGSWAYQGCITDNVNDRRTLQWQQILTNTNSAATCLKSCSDFGYMAGGMEYGSECYCGDAENLAAVGSTVRPESECGVPCSGNASAICGGGSRLSYYKWTGTPLYTFKKPVGNAAGQYQQLIGGVVVPLLTTSGVNGKYTFVEKYGTGAPNSTGAYELDLASINDVSKAWRPMHVKTDVFCSASITLPDKAGRQINIGGWNGDSLYGVRLYWPDGSPGVWGVNDWEENVNELKLQTARWYPSAMIMTNGSILVVGGETGSNGAPVPNLEILPKAGGLVNLDFLTRTDPFNLYPFLAVLPSGGILIAYYNEARILDPITFATTKTLPNIPGTVSDARAGRTYPLEGTAMLLPQKAPYTEPLSMLICGGSTPGNAEAIDNCVSIQPDAATPKWTIERMPSQRVVVCMTALPDGTYMILNGAYHGVAGFGLAEFPNLQAHMYDPSQPVGSRFSIMANTTVARLYHSEAILLQDGRVMVSGSDPQDGVHPEEYRVEVFVPPYLLAGKTQPSFTMTNKDWTYGQNIQISATLPNGGPVRVSLMGAESSTHGNSMGQRTIFPAVSCGGGACTITAPPNAKICPPGWYQVFVLDGPTPSKSIWVRIGGDPGALGNWPNLPDFKRPGI